MEMRACIMLAMLLFTAALRLIFAVQNSPTRADRSAWLPLDGAEIFRILEPFVDVTSPLHQLRTVNGIFPTVVGVIAC